MYESTQSRRRSSLHSRLRWKDEMRGFEVSPPAASVQVTLLGVGHSRCCSSGTDQSLRWVL